MDKAIDNTTKEEIFEIISTYKEIKGAKHFTSTPVGYQYLISISIDLDGNMSTFESHKIADSLEKKINKFIDNSCKSSLILFLSIYYM